MPCNATSVADGDVWYATTKDGSRRKTIRTEEGVAVMVATTPFHRHRLQCTVPISAPSWTPKGGGNRYKGIRVLLIISRVWFTQRLIFFAI